MRIQKIPSGRVLNLTSAYFTENRTDLAQEAIGRKGLNGFSTRASTVFLRKDIATLLHPLLIGEAKAYEQTHHSIRFSHMQMVDVDDGTRKRIDIDIYM